MDSPTISWHWQVNHASQRIGAAVAWYQVRVTLLNHLLNLDKEQYTQLQMVTNNDVVVILGEQSSLPWVDGIQYASCNESDSRLWLPSHLIPSVPVRLLADAFYQRYHQAPLLVWHLPQAIIPLDKPQTVTRARLKYLLEEQ